MKLVNDELERLDREARMLEQERSLTISIRQRLLSNPVNLKNDFTFDQRYTPVVVFDGDEAHPGYEDENGEWTEMDWPFSETWIWPDDCERLGFRVVNA